MEILCHTITRPTEQKQVPRDLPSLENPINGIMRVCIGLCCAFVSLRLCEISVDSGEFPPLNRPRMKFRLLFRSLFYLIIIPYIHANPYNTPVGALCSVLGGSVEARAICGFALRGKLSNLLKTPQDMQETHVISLRILFSSGSDLAKQTPADWLFVKSVRFSTWT